MSTALVGRRPGKKTPFFWRFKQVNNLDLFFKLSGMRV